MMVVRSFDRQAILHEFPWMTEKGHLMISGNDVDSLLSVFFLHHHLGWNLIGFYNYETIWYADQYELKDAKEAIWVDLDIYHKEVRSVGHHVLKFRTDDVMPGHVQSLNPNLLRGVDYTRGFAVKYPLGTIHFLLWLVNVDLPQHEDARFLFWLPDSSWINAQSHRFRENVEDWLWNCIPVPGLQSTFKEVDTADYERYMEAFFGRLISQTGFKRGRGQVASRHLKLCGLQCTFKQPDEHSLSCVRRLADFVSDIAGYSAPEIPAEYQHVTGIRNPNRKDLAGFLEREKVFSYVIPNRDTINYTTFENIF